METKNNPQVAEVQLSYKTKVKASERPYVSTSGNVYEVFKANWNYDVIEFIEEFKVMLLNRANRVIGIIPISIGGTTGTIPDPKVIFVAALKCAASGISLAHSHPSGNLKPSTSDIELTHKLIGAGKFLDIPVLDHIIMTSEEYLSFADEGII